MAGSSPPRWRCRSIASSPALARHRFHVVDYDAADGTAGPAGRRPQPTPTSRPPGSGNGATGTQFARPQDRGGRAPNGFPAAMTLTLMSDPEFHAQNAYAIAARTLAAFEFALGRRVDWATGFAPALRRPACLRGGQRPLRARGPRAVLRLPAPGPTAATINTCLSHDIVCHETTHAILDGLRRRFMEPALPRPLGVWTGVGGSSRCCRCSCTARSSRTTPGHLNLEDADQRRISSGHCHPRRAGQDGAVRGRRAVRGGHLGSARQRAAALAGAVRAPDREGLRDLPAFTEPHRRGEILVAAVLDALLEMWTARLDALIHEGTLNRARAAEDGANPPRT